MGAGAARPRCIEASGCDQTFIQPLILSPDRMPFDTISNTQRGPDPWKFRCFRFALVSTSSSGHLMMDETDRERLALQVFSEICEMTEPQRTVTLDERCAADSILRQRVTALLLADGESPA